MNSTNDQIKHLTATDGKTPVIYRCYICSKEITDEKDKLEMHGEIVCSQCWDDNMYMALQDGGGC